LMEASQKVGQMSAETFGFALTAYLTEAVVLAGAGILSGVILGVAFAVILSYAMLDLEQLYFTYVPEMRRRVLYG
jgi:ABC-type branched-subunit amino acid transport system permease subunit